MLVGYRTYITLALMVLHQVLKVNGIDLPQENLSIAVDTILALLAGVFKYLATKQGKCEKPVANAPPA